MRAMFIVTGPLLGYAMDRYGVHHSLLVLAVVFAPAMALVLLPLVARIAGERRGAVADRQVTAA